MSSLFSPLTLRDATSRDRIGVAPMSRLGVHVDQPPQYDRARAAWDARA